MKIAYIGDKDILAAGIMERLRKEEHDIYFLSKEAVSKTDKKFGRYKSYRINHHKDVKTIFTTVRPEVVIYEGIGYAQKNWGPEQENNLVLITAVLESCVSQSINTLVCLSSYEVYGVTEGVITEDTPLKPVSKKGLWMAEEEHLITSYQQVYGMHTSILRLSEVFSTEISIGAPDMLGQLSKRILNNETLDLQEQFQQPVHVMDVADAVKRVVEGGKSAVYNVSSSFSIKKSELVEKVGNILGKTPVFQLTEEESAEVIISNNKIKKEWEWTDFWQLEKLLDSYHISFQQPEDDLNGKTRLGLPENFRKTVENLVLFGCFAFLYQWTHEHNLFSQIQWLLIYVVVTSLCYGIKQGALSILLAGACYFWVEDKNILEMTNFYSYMKNILIVVEYMFFGIAVGYSINMLREQIRAKDEEIFELRENYEKLKDIHEKNVIIKDEYEKRVLDSKNSLPRLYHIINKFNVLDTERIFVEVLHVVHELMDTDTVSVYKYSTKTPYLRLIAALNDKSTMAGKSWNMENIPELKSVMESGQIYEGDIWKEEPAIVLPIMSSKGCQAIIIIKEVPMVNMSLYSINMLRTLLVLLSETLEKALYYEERVRKERYLKDTDILKPEEFQKAFELAKEKKQRKLADYGLLKLESDREFTEVYRQISSMFRQMDLLGTDGNGGLYVLLSNASAKDVVVVLERLHKKEINAKEAEEFIAGEQND